MGKRVLIFELCCVEPWVHVDDDDDGRYDVCRSTIYARNDTKVTPRFPCSASWYKKSGTTMLKHGIMLR